MASIRSGIGENMDRYLYKAKRLDNGEWVQGYLFGIWEKRYILWGMTNDIPNMIEVDPTTICQCTGVKDKNGKLIWENDIILCKVGTAKVIWNRSEWRIEWLKNDLWRKDLYYWAVEDIQRTVVIGNIFDNKELLEKEDKDESNY